MPIRSGAMQRPNGCRCGNTLRQRYDEVGLPCSSTMGSPCPTSTYAISLPRTCRRCFRYGNAAEILFASNAAETMFASPGVADDRRRANAHPWCDPEEPVSLSIARRTQALPILRRLDRNCSASPDHRECSGLCRPLRVRDRLHRSDVIEVSVSYRPTRQVACRRQGVTSYLCRTRFRPAVGPEMQSAGTSWKRQSAAI
jgi:hypothetical protein